MNTSASSSSNALVKSDKARLLVGVGHALAHVAAITTPGSFEPKGGGTSRFNSTAWRVRQQFERLVRLGDDATSPLFVTRVAFTPGVNNRGEMIVSPTYIEVPGKGQVPAVPHIVIDGNGGLLPFFGEQTYDTGNGQIAIKATSQSHWCMVLRPRYANEPYRLLPLAMGGAAVKHWNNIAQNMRAVLSTTPKAELDEKWPIVTPWQHRLWLPERYRAADLKPLKLFVTFQPTTLEARGKKADDEGTLTYGTLYGMSVMDATGGDLANTTNDLNSRHVFLVCSLSEKALHVSHDGQEGVSGLRAQTTLEVEATSIDGYEALGLTLVEANPLDLGKHVADLQQRLLEENPLYHYALARGVVEVSSDLQLVRGMLRSLALEASEMIRRDIADRLQELANRLTTAILPTIDEIGDLYAAYTRKEGEDHLASWIQKDILMPAGYEEAFNWKSYLHRKLRAKALEFICQRAEVEFPPQKPNPVTETVVETPTEVAKQEAPAAVDHAQETASAPAEEPKKGKRGSGNSKNRSSSATA